MGAPPHLERWAARLLVRAAARALRGRPAGVALELAIRSRNGRPARRADLNRLGVASLFVFGLVARNEATSDSDGSR